MLNFGQPIVKCTPYCKTFYPGSQYESNFTQSPRICRSLGPGGVPDIKTSTHWVTFDPTVKIWKLQPLFCPILKQICSFKIFVNLTYHYIATNHEYLWKSKDIFGSAICPDRILFYQYNFFSTSAPWGCIHTCTPETSQVKYASHPTYPPLQKGCTSSV